MEHCNFQFDEEFLEINGLKYLPWIGKNALEQKERVLIIGESVYNWGKNEEEINSAQDKLEKNDFARVVVYEHGIENPISKRKFARNIEKTISNELNSEIEHIEFWENVLFHEYVQRPMKNIKERPTNEDYSNGAKILTELFRILQPNKCIFLGTTWSKFENIKKSIQNHFTFNEIHFNTKINNTHPKILHIIELNLKIYFIKHPSSFYTPELWKDFIKNN